MLHVPVQYTNCEQIQLSPLIVYMVINKNQYVFRSDLFVIHGHP